MSSDDHEYGTNEYYHERALELEKQRNKAQAAAKYYRTQLAKAHEMLGRVTHQLSERWGTVNLTEYFPTDNLHRKKTGSNPTGGDAK